MMTARLRRTGVAGALVAAVVALSAPAALANETESDKAAVLVQQAVSLLANDNTPAVVLERIEDALAAPDQEGVDRAAVEQARGLAERWQSDRALREQVRLALERANGREPATGERATGEETGTTVVLDEYRPPRGVSDRGDAVLVALAVASLLGGLALSRALRPKHSLHELRTSTRRAAR